MKNIIIIFFIFILLQITSIAQAPDTLWTKTFGGLSSDVGYYVLQTSDSGYIVAGTTESFGAGGSDIYMVRADKNGDTLWTRTFGGINDDDAMSIKHTEDNGFIIAGSTSSFGNGASDMLLLKVDSLGNTEWFKTYGGAGYEEGKDAIQTFDGGYVIVGDSDWANVFGGGGWTVKTDQQGNILWSGTTGQSSWDAYYPKSVIQLNDGTFLVCGTEIWHMAPNGELVYWCFLTKYSTNGGHLWDKSYGEGYDYGIIIKKLNDGNIVVGGTTCDIYPPYDIILRKVNSSGGIFRYKIIGEEQTSENLYSLDPTFDDGIVVLYRSSSGNNIGLLKVDSDFNIEWDTTVYGAEDDCGFSVQETSDGGFIATGRTKSFGAGSDDIWLLRFDNNPPSNITLDSPNGGEHWLTGNEEQILWTSEGIDSIKIELSLDNGLQWQTITESTSSDGLYDWVVQAPQSSQNCKIRISDVIDSTVSDISDTTFTIETTSSVPGSPDFNIPNQYRLSQNHPNPFNPTTIIRFDIPEATQVNLDLYDILGRKVESLISNEIRNPGRYEVNFDASSLTSGVYIYKLTTKNYSQANKMLLIK